MNEILNNKSPRKELAPKLKALYVQVPNWKDILDSVRVGHSNFINDIKSIGLNIPADTSAVHVYPDVEAQAFILGIPSNGNSREITTKAYLTYGAHWIDDFFDNQKLGVQTESLFPDRHNIKKVLANMGAIGQVGILLAEKVPHPEGVYKGLSRMLYGGLVQRSRSRSERAMLMQEYQELGVQSVDSRVAKEIRSVQREAYWMTNKTIQEFINASESSLDFTVAELWSLIYAPALYYHDIAEEERHGESSFESEEKPRDEEMIRMIRIGGKYLLRFPDDKLGLRMQQLRIVSATFRETLPKTIAREYKLIFNRHRASEGGN